jgi:hypothetical protein
MGGNRFNRQNISDEKIYNLFHDYSVNENKLKSLFSAKILKNEKLWQYDVIRHLDKECCNKLFYLIDRQAYGSQFCAYCPAELDINSYTYGKTRYSKYCPDCILKGVWRSNYTEEELAKRGEKITDAKLSFYQTDKGKEVAKSIGEKNAINMTEYLKTDKGIAQVEKSRIENSTIMLQKIASGEFTPNISNSWTHWDAEIIIDNKSKKFRSSWEACFYMSNPNLLYEKLRLPYLDKMGTIRTYIADFYDDKNNILYEIKPISVWPAKNEKMQQIINYCLNNGIKFVWINEKNILDYIDESDFDEINLSQYNKLLSGLKCIK